MHLGTPIIFRDRLWQFRVFTDCYVLGHSETYYTPATAEAAGRVGVGDGGIICNFFL